MHHVGKVLKLFRGDGKGVIASDSSVQAYVEMWDENKLIISVHPALNSEIKENDFVLAKYAQPEPLIIKILRGKQGEALWNDFKKHFERKKRSAPKPMPIDLEVPEEHAQLPAPMVR